MKNEDLLVSEEQEKSFCKIDKILKKYVKEARLEIFIYGEIPDIDSDETVTLIDSIETSRADQIIVTIMSRGGSLYSSIAIYNALMAKKNEAQIITIGNSIVASGAALIFMAGSLRYSYKYTNFLFHAPSIEGYISGKIGNYNEEYNAINNLYNKMVRENLFPMLPEDEINKMMIGKDLYFDTDAAIQNGMVHMLLEDLTEEDAECEEEESIDEGEDYGE